MPLKYYRKKPKYQWFFLNILQISSFASYINEAEAIHYCNKI